MLHATWLVSNFQGILNILNILNLELELRLGWVPRSRAKGDVVVSHPWHSSWQPKCIWNCQRRQRDQTLHDSKVSRTENKGEFTIFIIIIMIRIIIIMLYHRNFVTMVDVQSYYLSFVFIIIITAPRSCFPLVSPLNKYCSCSKVFCGFLTSEVCTVTGLTGDWRYSSPRTSNSSRWTTLSVHSHTGNHTITALANALICINKYWYSNIISQWVELTPNCSLHDFCSKPLQYSTKVQHSATQICFVSSISWSCLGS